MYKNILFQLIPESIKVEPLIDIKFEDNDLNQNNDAEFYETEYIDEEFSQFDPDVRSVLDEETSVDITIANTFDDTKYVCDYCGQHFDRKSHLGSHMTKHRKENWAPTRFPCTVKGCSKVFETRRAFSKHRLGVHKIRAEPRTSVAAVPSKQEKFCCTQCPKWFLIQVKLDAHIRSKHEGLKVSLGKISHDMLD